MTYRAVLKTYKLNESKNKGRVQYHKSLDPDSQPVVHYTVNSVDVYLPVYLAKTLRKGDLINFKSSQEMETSEGVMFLDLTGKGEIVELSTEDLALFDAEEETRVSLVLVDGCAITCK